MARPDKVAVVDEVSESLTSHAATLLTDYRGLTVTELAELRARLREANATYKVVKNTLTRRAAAEAGVEGLHDYLEGPTALVFCEDDPVGPMKAIRDFMRDHPELLVKAGWVEGEVLDEQATIKLADLASRDELLAELAGLLYGALANFARLLQAPLDTQARLIKALEDEGGPAAKGFDVGTDTEAEAVAEAAPEAADAATTDEPEPEPEPEEDASVVEQAAGAATEAAQTAADAVETVAEAATGAAEAVADTVESAAEAVTGDEPDQDEPEPEPEPDQDGETGQDEETTS